MAASSRLQLHQAVDHRRREDARRDTVSEALSAGDQSVHLRDAHVDFEPACLDCLGDAIEARREFDGQVRDVDAELFQARNASPAVMPETRWHPAVRGGHQMPEPDDVAEVGQPVADQNLGDLTLAVIAGADRRGGHGFWNEPTSVVEGGHACVSISR